MPCEQDSGRHCGGISPLRSYRHMSEGADLEQTLVILKPNAVQRELVGEIIARFEKRGLRIAALRMTVMSRALAELHYGEHSGKPFFEDLVAFMTSGPLVVLVLEAKGAVQIVRSMAGSTDPALALPGTIRGDYATTAGHNMIHAADSADAAEREIALFFPAEEIYEYSLAVKPWL
jgi:nucleoside-diphosphate kinase